MNNPWVKKTNEERIKRQIKNIIDWFNFDAVHQAMTALNWNWVGEGVPDEERLKERAEELLKDVAKEYLSREEDRWYIACGGFKATCEEGIMTLEFIIDDWTFQGDTDIDTENNTLERC